LTCTNNSLIDNSISIKEKEKESNSLFLKKAVVSKNLKTEKILVKKLKENDVKKPKEIEVKKLKEIEVKKSKGCQDVKIKDSWSGDYSRGIWNPCENGTSCKPINVKSGTAWLVQGAGTYVLESQEFRFETKSILKFQYQFVEKNFKSKLRLCIDTLDSCPFAKRGSSQEEKWSEESMVLYPGWHKIYFTATNLKKSDDIKVHQISVESKEDNCILTMTLAEE